MLLSLADPTFTSSLFTEGVTIAAMLTNPNPVPLTEGAGVEEIWPAVAAPAKTPERIKAAPAIAKL